MALSKMNSRLDVELNPMENLVIMSNIFKFCSVNDLKNCRLVGSKVWLRASRKAWRKKAILKIKTSNSMRRLNMNDSHRGISIHELLNAYDDDKDPFLIQNNPFRNYKLEGARCYGLKEGIARHCDLQSILTRCGNLVQGLTLKDYEFSPLSSFLGTIFHELPNLVELKLEGLVKFSQPSRDIHYPRNTNLKRIIIQMGKLYGPVCPKWFKWENLLGHLTALQSLRIIPPSGSSGQRKIMVGEEMKMIMNAVAAIREKDPSKLQLKDLECSYIVVGNAFIKINNCMPLERLTASVMDVVDLNIYSTTLEYLNLFFSKQIPVDGVRGDDEANFPNLKELNVNGRPSKVFANLNKINSVNLETLVVENLLPRRRRRGSLKIRESANMTMLVNTSFEKVNKLECFHNSSMYYVVSGKDLEMLSQSMPNVKHAKMPLTRKSFRKLCMVWPNLLTLTVSDDNGQLMQIDDETITGIKPDSDCHLRDGAAAEPPNIRHLKLLTAFTYSGTLGEHSVHYGFLHLPRLDFLNVKLNKIAAETELLLKMKISVVEMEVGSN